MDPTDLVLTDPLLLAATTAVGWRSLTIYTYAMLY
jgi:hypothetical protein